MQEILSKWSDTSCDLMRECFGLAVPYLDQNNDEVDPYISFVLHQLLLSCHLSSESSLLLIKSGMEWDADIINRSVMEGTIKFIFLMLGEPDDVKRKAFEFWELLPSYASIRHHDRATGVLKNLPVTEDPESVIFEKLLLDDKEIQQLRNDTNRVNRQRLERKWSFSEITRSFSNGDSENLALLVHLAHGYGMSSHLIHKDGDGVGMVWERFSREKKRQMAVKLGHCARIVSDVCTFSILRLHQLLTFCGQDTAKVVEVEQRYQFLFHELQKAGGDFMEAEFGQSCKDQTSKET